MAKGDWEIHKADIDDGYTKIANLLLEALAMAKLNGVQKGICLFLWRRTYGWGVKEDEITLQEFAEACDSEKSYVSRQLKKLVDWNVIIRTSYQPGKVSAFTFNTRVDQWDKCCLNTQGLSNKTTQGLFKRTTQGLSKRTTQGLSKRTTVEQGSDQEPCEVEPPLKKYIKKYKENNIYTIFEHWNSKKIITHRKLSDKQRGHINARLEEGYTVEEITEAIDNYATVLSGDDYFFSYRWKLEEFLLRGLDRFKTESNPLNNFRKNKGDNPRGSPRTRLDSKLRPEGGSKYAGIVHKNG